MNRSRVVRAVAVLVTVALGVSACTGSATKKGTPVPTSSGPSGSTGSAGSAPKQGGTVTIANEQGQTWTCQFNPFNPAVYLESVGFVYEPLVFVNMLRNQEETPMLASSYKWGPGKKSIVFTIRKGVTWSDGQPLTPDDVVFTFDILRDFPATDVYSLWKGAGLNSVTASGDKVTMTFNQAAQTYFYYFADQVGIVPKHIWSTGEQAAHPDSWPDKDPVGTGPYQVNPCSPNNIQYTANPSHWQQGKPYIQKVEYPAYLDNGPANLDLATGKAQWGSQFIPNIDQFYLSRSSDNHTWSPPVTNVAIYPNLDPSHKATSTLAVRQAITSALDRAQISQIGEGGQQPPANQTGIVSPTFDTYLDSAALSASGYDKPNVERAKQLMQSAGYSTSHPLKLSIITVTGYTDWDASLAVIKQQLQPIGIDLTVQDLAQQTFDSRLYQGDFDLAYYGEVGGPTPYYEMRRNLYSKNTAPLGTDAGSNYERYKNPAVDALFDQYATASDAEQVTIIKKIEKYMLDDVPVISTTEGVDWFQYNTADIEGWPTEQDPYAQPSAFQVPDAEQVVLHLYSKSA